VPSPTDYAVFTELSPNSKPAKPGWNRRIFTDTDAYKGGAIQCDFATGLLTLAPGTYQISGLSAVAYFAKDDPPETVVPRSPASAGYCRLRCIDPDIPVDPANMRELANSHPTVLCIGSPSTANLVPSVFETFYETDKPAQLVLEHQSGSNPDQIYLRVFVGNSKWHLFARIAIRRL
jgi:hypothetical protein